MAKEDRVCNGMIIGLISAILHVSFLIMALKLSGFVQAEEPEQLSELIMELPSPDTPIEMPAPPEPPEPEPPAPPEPPQPEPPAPPEPPQPEPPAPPEPPQPEPPKIEPKPEPPKIEPKPEPPKIEPKPEPPKIEPKPEPPKPKPEPPKPMSKIDKIRERMKNSRVVKVDAPPVPTPRPQPVQPSEPLRVATKTEEYIERFQSHRPKQPAVSAQLGSVQRSKTVQQQSINYAELVVKPLYYNHWKPPTVGRNRPTPVVVELQVTNDGMVRSARIVTPSNDQRMNDSVQELIDTVRKLTPFAQAGVTESSLTVRVTLDVEVR